MDTVTANRSCHSDQPAIPGHPDTPFQRWLAAHGASWWMCRAIGTMSLAEFWAHSPTGLPLNAWHMTPSAEWHEMKSWLAKAVYDEAVAPAAAARTAAKESAWAEYEATRREAGVGYTEPHHEATAKMELAYAEANAAYIAATADARAAYNAATSGNRCPVIPGL